ncbi:MAG: class I mannose-6-phosphate isomerase [Eubacteriales bacterium]|jgi:mannose-6-phosphate isomerase|nr:class I mannose-6-phosphate isomerase [Eubacteriales bacterium]
MMYPLKMQPTYKQYLWGGENLKKLYGKDTPQGNAAESWEVSCHPNGQSSVANGKYKGQTLAQVVSSMGEALLGKTISPAEKFPLLLKILDANDKLSVQVHPDDEYAMKNENGEKGKTEMWYVLDCKPGAQLVYGFKEGVTKEIFENAIKGGTLEEILNKVNVNKGDAFFIPAGTVHAIGEGIIIAEIQQNSDTTYRVYDYNRKDKDGNTRPLHIEKALDVSNFESSVGKEKAQGSEVLDGENIRTILASCRYFNFEKLEIKEKSIENTDGRMEIILVAEGSGKIAGESFKSADSFVIPAAMGEYAVEGKCTLLKSYIA